VALRDPVAIYNAADNLEAAVLSNALVEAGIEAYFVEDVSQVGTWLGGLIPEIHKPQVWVDRTAVEQALPILRDHERRLAERRAAPAPDATLVEAVCEECGGRGYFPVAQRGTVQDCPHCGTFLDVGEIAGPDTFAEEVAPEDEP
jgi:hypothetical protein